MKKYRKLFPFIPILGLILVPIYINDTGLERLDVNAFSAVVQGVSIVGVALLFIT